VTKVAIVMPYYNEKELLVKSVQAVFAQSYTDWRLFIIDDGSKPENSMVQALNGIKLDYTKMCTIVKENGGVSTARNQALDLIKHSLDFEYVAYCDSDDVWDKDYLEKQMQLLENEKPDMVYSAVRHRFLDGSVAVPFGISNPETFPGTEELIKGNCIFVSGVIHKKECIRVVGEFDPLLNSIEDWDYWVRISKAGYKIVKNSNACFTYTVKGAGNGGRRTEAIFERFQQKHAIINNNTNS
jgi:glycosyltransferase involved in cell wall biosynthesis